MYLFISAILVLVAFFSLAYYLSGSAYIIKGGENGPLLYPDGRPVEVYDGNDQKHFPKWTEANHRAAGLIK